MKNLIQEKANFDNWLFLFGFYVLCCYLIYYIFSSQTSILLYPIDLINLGTHELGHLVGELFGKFFGAVNGTLFELLLPIIIFIVAILMRWNYLIKTLLIIWLSFTIVGVGEYMLDANAMTSSLVAFGGGLNNFESIHDWNYIFEKLGLLDKSEIIGITVIGIGWLFSIIALSYLLAKYYSIYRLQKTGDN